MEGLEKNILIVEDDEVLLRALYLEFKGAGFNISSATDGETAIGVAERIKPDLILLDLIIPRKDGFEVLKTLKDNTELKKIPVIILSNLGDDEDIKRTKDMGAVDYFIKSDTNLDVLLKKIKKYLA